jgi:hypothetical protein
MPTVNPTQRAKPTTPSQQTSEIAPALLAPILPRVRVVLQRDLEGGGEANPDQEHRHLPPEGCDWPQPALISVKGERVRT